MNTYHWQPKYEAAITCHNREVLSERIEEARVALSKRIIQIDSERDVAEHIAIYNAVLALAAIQTEVLDAAQQPV